MPPRGSQRIKVFEAARLTERHRKASPASEHGGFFWADGVRAILDQPGCAGLRYYHGLDTDGRYQIVLVGVDGEGRDIVEVRSRREQEGSEKRSAVANASAVAESEAVVLDNHWPCPHFCDSASPLA